MNKLYIITGPSGVGKSTISEKIANKLDKSVLIEGDYIYNQFMGGKIRPWEKDAPLDLFWDNCFLLISNYLENGYDVVFNYIIKQKELDKIKVKYKKYDINFTVLLTDEETIVKRDKLRPLDCQMGERSLILLNEFKNEDFNNDNILDTSTLEISECVDKIINDDRFRFKKININEIKTPEDILKYMRDNIEYGWSDISNRKHIGNMKGFRSLYITQSIENILIDKIGTCIEQVWLMKNLFDKINIKSKMFCTRIYENNEFNKLNEEEHMHCFILYYLNNEVFHMEHPNGSKIGIYKYDSEEEALNSINNYFINMSGGIARPVTEYFIVEPNLTFKQFNNYINSIDVKEIKK